MRSFWPVPLKNKRGNYKGRKSARANHFLCYRYPTLALEQGDLVQNMFHVNIMLWQSNFCRPIRHIPIVTYAAVAVSMGRWHPSDQSTCVNFPSIKISRWRWRIDWWRCTRSGNHVVGVLSRRKALSASARRNLIKNKLFWGLDQCASSSSRGRGTWQCICSGDRTNRQSGEHIQC